MYTTEFAHIKGITIPFKPANPIIGNCAHADQTVYFVVASGSLEGHFQQMMVKNPSDHMDVLSPEIQINESGCVESIYPSSKESQIFHDGSLIEIRPGCAYAFMPLSEGVLIKYLIPSSLSTSLFNHKIGQINEETVSDQVSFELLKPAKINEPIKHEAPIKIEKKEAPNSGPLPQKYFYREDGTTLLNIGKYSLGFMLSLGLLVSSHHLIWFLVFLALTATSGYWLALEGLFLYRKTYSLGIEEDGLTINNCVYSDLVIPWSEISRFQLEARTFNRYGLESELEIRIITNHAEMFIQYANPVERFWHKSRVQDPTVIPPKISIKQSDVSIDLNLLLTQLEGLRQEALSNPPADITL